jgi:hypothetical protein
LRANRGQTFDDRGERERDFMPFPRILATSFLIALPFSVAGYAQPPARESTVVVYGDDPCPRANGDEIVVCARRPEEERYRIPRRIRERQPTETSWASRVESLEEVSRPGRPGSCSVVGSFGQSGCTQALIRQWYADRRAKAAEDAGIP